MTAPDPLIAEIPQHVLPYSDLSKEFDALIPTDRTLALKPRVEAPFRSPVGDASKSDPTGL